MSESAERLLHELSLQKGDGTYAAPVASPRAREKWRANWVGAPEFYELNQACRTITEAYGDHLYLVGSVLTRRDHRDVDLRLILPDAEYDALFPGQLYRSSPCDARWSLMCSTISLWLSTHTGLKIDFQVQRQTQANEDYPQGPDRQGERCAVGIFWPPRKSNAL